MNDDLYYNKDGKAAEMFICYYTSFENLYIDWFYLLNNRESRMFDIETLHADKIYAKGRPYIQLRPGEENSPFIIRDGAVFLNLDAQKDGKAMSFLNHTSMRKIDLETEEEKKQGSPFNVNNVKLFMDMFP